MHSTGIGQSLLGSLPEVRRFEQRLQRCHEMGVAEPYLQLRDSAVGLDFCSYDYLGLSEHPKVKEAATQAIHDHGCSVSASRLVGGELALHRDLEEELADFLGTEAAMVMVSGYGTNLNLLAHLLGPKDLILHDTFAHSSAINGALASGAKRIKFAHNDLQDLEQHLIRESGQHRRSLVWVEGLYSMDGDIPDLAGLERLQRQHGFLLMVDEAHSIGVLGSTGRGLAEHCAMTRSGDTIWMGTLSKALGSCGGFLAGERSFIEYLKHALPGFVYSVGLPPSAAAAALAALRVLKAEPERVASLADRSLEFSELLRTQGWDTGRSVNKAVVPVMLGHPERALSTSEELAARGVQASAIISPAVAWDKSRLRFFVRHSHREDDFVKAVATLQDVLGTGTL